MRFPFLAALAFLLAGSAAAQPLSDWGPHPPPAAVVVTELPVAPRLNAVGYAGAALWTDDPHAFLLNPAHLGALGRETSIGISGWPGAQSWTSPSFADEVWTGALGAGTDLGRWGVPLYGGVGVARTALEGFNQEAFAFDREAFTAIGAGVETQGRVALSAGATVRFGEARNTGSYLRIGSPPAEEGTVTPAPHGAFTSYDAGVRLALPVLALDLPTVDQGRLFLDAAVGYARTNMGGSVSIPAFVSPWLTVPDREGPVAQVARFGYAWTARVRAPLGGRTAEWVAVELATQAEHSLVSPGSQYPGYPYSYSARPVWDDIALFAPALVGRSDFGVVGRTGVRARVLDVAEVAWGRFGHVQDATHMISERSHGWTLRPLGLLRAFGTPRAAHFAQRYDLAVSRSVYYAREEPEGPPRAPLTGVTLTVRP